MYDSRQPETLMKSAGTRFTAHQSDKTAIKSKDRGDNGPVMIRIDDDTDKATVSPAPRGLSVHNLPLSTATRDFNSTNIEQVSN